MTGPARHLRSALAFAGRKEWALAGVALGLAIGEANRLRDRKLSGRILLALARVQHAATCEASHD